MKTKIKLGIVAALEREIKPLVRDWKVERIPAYDRKFKAYRTSDVALMCAGIGSAWDVTKVLIETYDPEVVLSVGFAGSLDAALSVPEIFIPAQVVEERTGAGFSTGVGRGTLVTVRRVADQQEKHRLVQRLDASAVDMEACQVAEVAKARGCRFIAIKVISDNFDTDMSFIGDFVTPAGFATAAFLAHIALRPRLWGAVRELQANSNRAQKVLCRYLELIIKNLNRLEHSLALAADFSASASTTK